jgi:Protein of unknown function (DUF5818)
MRYLQLLAVLLLCGVWATAQNNPSSQTSSPDPSTSTQTTGSTSAGSDSAGSSQKDSSMSETGTSGNSVEGCLSGSDGNYTLTDQTGASYKLTGDTAKLSEHIGHEVKITGTKSSASATGASDTMGQTGGAQQSIEVTSVKHVSKTCKGGASPTK